MLRPTHPTHSTHPAKKRRRKKATLALKLKRLAATAILHPRSTITAVVSLAAVLGGAHYFTPEKVTGLVEVLGALGVLYGGISALDGSDEVDDLIDADVEQTVPRPAPPTEIKS